MRKKDCNLCLKYHIKSGKDKLLYEDRFCYIVDNGNTHLNINGKLIFAKKRVSLVIKNHKKILNLQEKYKVNRILTDFMQKKFNLEKSKDYFLKSTMGTYPDHFHFHAYIPPFSEKGVIK